MKTILTVLGDLGATTQGMTSARRFDPQILSPQTSSTASVRIALTLRFNRKNCEIDRLSTVFDTAILLLFQHLNFCFFGFQCGFVVSLSSREYSFFGI